MKQRTFFALLLGLSLAAFTACNNDSGNNTSDTDTTKNNNTSAEMNTSGDYAAYADEIERNSAQGRYINPRTGKPYSRLNVNRETGEITDENNEPVWRYVDTETWWVYGLEDDDWTWRRIGEARMDNDRVMYKDENGNWVSYDVIWKDDDDNMSKSWKTKSGDTKIKFDKDGDIKVKDESGKVKYDADDNKIKTDSSR